ncbi:hypothetical protein AB0M46_03070 [Dactylosporangium sp. NPDC051485]|uniref:hypothetical protein n=1 Tax=Dactylosporangium sp. NPDC051485 TaxID=3154846 RepID=UPI0034444889
MRWPWVVVPPLYVLAAGALAHALPLGRFFVFGVLVLAGLGVGHLLTDPRRRADPPARPGWSFPPPARPASARIGYAFAAAAIVVIDITLLTTDPLSIGIAVVVAALPLAVGVQLLARLVRGTPALRLNPAGIEVRGTPYPWERIAAVELNGDPANPRLDVLLIGRRQPVALRPLGVDANLLFLLDLLGYYHANPAARPLIGDPSEAERTHALLLRARLAAGLRGGPRPIVTALGAAGAPS